MSTPHRLLTEEFVAIYQRGHHKPAQMPCKLAHWTGGGQYDDPTPPLPISLNATAALHQLTHGEFAMPTRYDYDAHYHAMRGDHAIGRPLPERDDRWPLWLSVPAIIGVSIVLWSIVIVAGVGLRAMWEALS